MAIDASYIALRRRRDVTTTLRLYKSREKTQAPFRRAVPGGPNKEGAAFPWGGDPPAGV